LAVGLGVGLSRKGTSSDPGSQEEDVELAEFLPPFTDTMDLKTLYSLDAYVLNQIQTNSASSEYLANRWIYGHPDRENMSAQRLMSLFCQVNSFYAFNGFNWTNRDHWLDYHVHECDWYTSHHEPENVCDEHGNIVIYNLTRNNLGGTSPVEMQFPELRIADISFNQIGGPPQVVKSFQKLEIYSVESNNFKGPLRVEAAVLLPKLRVLKISNNDFRTTDDPAGIWGHAALFPKLEIYEGFNCNFSGGWPSWSGYTPHFRVWEVGHNKYFGTIPDSLPSEFPNIEIMNASFTDFSGTLPNTFGNLLNLTIVDLRGTQMTGSIPSGLCQAVEEGRLKVFADCDRMECCKPPRPYNTSEHLPIWSGRPNS